jgi:hypothetical protein
MKITLFTPSDFKNCNKPRGTRINEKTSNSSTMATESYKENIRKLTSYIHQLEREKQERNESNKVILLGANSSLNLYGLSCQSTESSKERQDMDGVCPIRTREVLEHKEYQHRYDCDRLAEFIGRAASILNNRLQPGFAKSSKGLYPLFLGQCPFRLFQFFMGLH